VDEYSVFVALIFANVIIKTTCFLLGYFIVKLGYKLTNDGVKGNFKFTGDYKGVKAGLASGTPGLLFLLLGAALIG